MHQVIRHMVDQLNRLSSRLQSVSQGIEAFSLEIFEGAADEIGPCEQLTTIHRRTASRIENLAKIRTAVAP
jgi:hypothetical protein